MLAVGPNRLSEVDHVADQEAGRPEQPVAQVAERAAEHQARAPIAQGSERSRRASTAMKPTTTTVTSGKIQVYPVPMLNAAPLLRVRSR